MLGPFCYPLEGVNMHKLNLIHFYQLGKEMRTLRDGNDKPHRAYTHLVGKYSWLSKFLVDTNDIPFPKTRAAARELHKFLSSVFHRADDKASLIVTSDEDLSMKILLGDF